MVLGFGSKKKKPSAAPVAIRTSPSLPELAQQRIPWPENLVDINAVHAYNHTSPLSEGHGTPHGASKTSFQGTRGPVPFHKPFRAGDASMPGSPVAPQPNTIAALFGSGVPPPSSFNGVGPRTRAGSHPLTHSRSTRRAKHAPTFNVMVAGAKQTGKSSLLRLLLDTSTISPTNTQEQLLSLSNYRTSSTRPTSTINTACVEILQGPANRVPGPEDRITLTCIDTPGLDFSEGKEFALDRAVSSVVRYVDLQFAETMGEESKVIRTSKGDQHVHLCIYLIDPDSIMTPSARRARSRLAASAFPAQPLSPSDLPEPSEYESGSDDEDGDDDEVPAKTDRSGDSEDEYGEPEPVSAPTPEQTPLTPISADDHTPRNSVDPASRNANNGNPIQSSAPKSQTHIQAQTQNRLGMSPAEIRVIARLAKRVNVLPIVARADTLTDGRLERVKRAVRRDLQAVGVDDEIANGNGNVNANANGSASPAASVGLGIFAVWDADTGALFGRKGSGQENLSGSISGAPNGNGRMQPSADDPDPEDERQSRPVIKLRERGPGSTRGLTRSRSRKSLKAVVGAEYDEPDVGASPGYPVSPPSTGHGHGHVNDGASLASPSRRTSVGSAHGTSSYGAVFSRADLRARMPFAIIAPERERERGKDKKKAGGSLNGHTVQTPSVSGRFVRRFRWGTVDVLDPQHCDFAALRAAVLGSYMRSLKATTKDVLYERFRTEKLLARRATANISDSDRKRIMQDLGL